MSVTYDFKGRRVLVTGGARGVGETIVAAFVKAGATVFALDRDGSNLKTLKEKFPNVETICVDLLNWNESKKAVEAIAPIHHLVNNAGIGEPQPFQEITSESIDKVVGINFKSMINMGQVVAKGFPDQDGSWGTIVNISSIMDNKTLAGIGMYSCTKAAVTMLTKVMAIELAPLNIRVNCVRPTLMRTGLLNPDIPNEKKAAIDVAEMCLGRQVQKRLAAPEETADTVLYLSSKASSMVNGSDILVDGGIYTS